MEKMRLKDINVGERARKNLGDIKSLALSIKSKGQIHPIVVEKREDGRTWLIAGERRYRAHEMLGAEEIGVTFRENLTDLERLEIELEENLWRADFDWKEEVLLKARIDKVKRDRYGSVSQGDPHNKGWGIVDTAAAMGQSIGLISEDLKLAKGIVKFPELAEQPNKKAAMTKLKALEERALANAIAKQKKLIHIDQPEDSRIFNGDCIAIMKERFKDSCIDLVIVDPPYGIDIADMIDTDANRFQEFPDDKAMAMDLLDQMLRELDRVMKPNSSIYMFYSTVFYTQVKELMAKYFNVDPIPYIWFKTNIGGGRTNAPHMYACRTYETALYARKGDRKLFKQGQPNVLPFEVVPAKQKVHMTEKPVMLLRELIDRASLPGEVVLDPCGGSGSTALAAKQMDRDYFTIEKNPHYYEKILMRLALDKKVLVPAAASQAEIKVAAAAIEESF